MRQEGMEQPLRVKKMMTKRMKRGTRRVMKMKRTVRHTSYLSILVHHHVI